MRSYMVHAASNHSLCVTEIAKADMPDFKYVEDYETFYEVRNWDKTGHLFFYLAKGHKSAPTQMVGWYSKGGFWTSYGKSFKETIDRMQEDGWIYA